MALHFTIDHPAEAQIRKLRRECLRYRQQRNEARAQAAQLSADLASATAEAGRLREALNHSTTARVVGA